MDSNETTAGLIEEMKKLKYDTDTMIIPPTPAMPPINIDPANTPANSH